LANELFGYADTLQGRGLSGFNNPGAVLLVAVTALVAGSFAIVFWKRRSVDAGRLVLAAAFTHLGWQSFKNMPLFAVAGMAVALWNFDDCWDLLPRLPSRIGPLMPGLTSALAFSMALAVPGNVYYEVLQKSSSPYRQTKFGFRELPFFSPHAEAEFLAGPNMPRNVFAVCHSMASAYIFRCAPGGKVFVDGRLEVNSRSRYERWFRIADLLLAHDLAAEKMLLEDVPADARGKREMPALLLDMDGFFGSIDALIEHPRWRPVFHGDSAVVFLYEPDAQQRGVPAVDRKELRVHWCRRAVEAAPQSAMAHFGLGKTLHGSNPVEAAEQFRQACELDPAFSEAHCNYAALIAAQQPDAAEEHLRIAIHCDPWNAGALYNYANLLVRKAKFAEAIRWYRQALAINPQFELARRGLALAEAKADSSRSAPQNGDHTHF
jgi:hypothetical protein